jgi:hypothetical protein
LAVAVAPDVGGVPLCPALRAAAFGDGGIEGKRDRRRGDRVERLLALTGQMFHSTTRLHFAALSAVERSLELSATRAGAILPSMQLSADASSTGAPERDAAG